MADDPDGNAAAGEPAGHERPRVPRTAVLIVHGIGNQRPLDTLRGIVETVWTTDPDVSGANGDHWLHLNRVNGDLDLPVVTTSTVAGRTHQVDFHELYWAHVMAETRLVAVLLWLFEFVRKGSRPLRPDVARLWRVAVPVLVAGMAAAALLLIEATLRLVGIKGVAPVWDVAIPWILTLVLVAVTMGWRGIVALAFFAIVILIAAALLQVGDRFHDAIFWRLGHEPSLFAAAGVVLAFAAMAAFFLTSVVGDAARYYRNSPANIRVRREIRAIGARTLAALHTKKYDRIVVVAHSLGSVIAYDILRAHWAEVCRSFGNVAGITGLAAQDRSPVRDGVEIGNDVPLEPAERTIWRNRGRALLANLVAARGTPEKPIWLVTDFVTLGSPLTHARYLNATGTNETDLAEYFAARLADREAPTCPPLYDGKDGRLTFTADGEDPASKQYLHHAALFGLTRWTNLHFPAGAYNGDLVGGDLGAVFGSAIRDVPLPRPKRRALSWHTWYWRWDGASRNLPPPPHIAALRAAINLLDEPET